MWQDRDARHPVGTGAPVGPAGTARDAPGQLLGSVCIWPSPGQDGDLFPFVGNHSCLYKMGIPAVSGNFQGPSHTRPLWDMPESPLIFWSLKTAE